jgi:hypothetical protein
MFQLLSSSGAEKSKSTTLKGLVYEVNEYNRLNTSKRINLTYQEMIIVTPFIELEKRVDPGGAYKYYSFKVRLLDYDFIQRFSSSDAEEAHRELKDKLSRCVYIVGKSGEIKSQYYGMKELCTDTQHDRFRLMKALISLGANKPPFEEKVDK